MIRRNLCGPLAEFGLVAPQGAWRLMQLQALAEDASSTVLPEPTRKCAALILVQIEDLHGRICKLERRIVARYQANELNWRLVTMPGTKPPITHFDSSTRCLQIVIII